MIAPSHYTAASHSHLRILRILRRDSNIICPGNADGSAVRCVIARLEQALALWRQGFNVIPTNRDKVALIKWKEGEKNYQQERVTEDEIRAWWTRWPNANIGIITGAISGIFVIDADNAAALATLVERGLVPTRTVQSRRGFHFYYRWPGFHVYNTKPIPDVDIKGDGGLITAPGSIHKSGFPYTVYRDLPIADAPNWLIEMVRPKPLPEWPALPRREISADERTGLKPWAIGALLGCAAELAQVGSHRNEMLRDKAIRLGSIAAHGLLDRLECEQALEDACHSNNYLAEHDHRSFEATFNRSFDFGLANPCRDLPEKTACAEFVDFAAVPRTAARRQSDSFYNHMFTLGEMVERLNRDASAATADLPKGENRSRRSAYRDICAINRNSIDTKDVVIKSGTTAADSHFPTTWIRNAFPLSDPLTALIPIRLLTPELFAGALTDDEIDDLQDQPFVVDLTAKQRFAVKYRMKLLAQVKRLASQLDQVPFVIADGQHFDNPAALRREVFRQIVDYFATDPTTGKKTESELSNVIQACLVGCTVGALPSIRAGAGVEQIAGEKQEKAITSAQGIPSNAVGIVVRSADGLKLNHYPDPRADYIPALLERHRAQGQVTYALVQPVSRQRIIDRPVAQAAECEESVTHVTPSDTTLAKKVSEKSDSPTAKTGTIVPTPRRPWREVYAARLMRGLLHHANVAADESEPLDVLADKLRSLLKPTAPKIFGKYSVPTGHEIAMQRLYNASVDAKYRGDGKAFLAALDDTTRQALEAYANDDPAPETVVIQA